MSIDIDINEMFDEKNRTIFINKLLMDLDNNIDTFKITIKNIVKIEIAKLGSSIKKIYDKYYIEYSDDKIREIFKESQDVLLEDIQVLIDEKKNHNSEFINESNEKKINKTYLRDYGKKIEENDASFEENLKLTVSEHLESSLYKTIIGFYPCSNEEMHQEIIYSINVGCCQKINSRVKEENRQRSGNLKNMAKETYDKYLLLVNRSLTSKNNSVDKKTTKVKIKQDN